MKSTKIIIGKTASAMNEPWYKREGTATDINHFLKLPASKAVSYFKVFRRIRGGAGIHEQYWKTLDNGYMIYIDLGTMKMGIVQGLPSPFAFSASTKKEYVTAQKKILKALLT